MKHTLSSFFLCFFLADLEVGGVLVPIWPFCFLLGRTDLGLKVEVTGIELGLGPMLLLIGVWGMFDNDDDGMTGLVGLLGTPGSASSSITELSSLSGQYDWNETNNIYI